MFAYCCVIIRKYPGWNKATDKIVNIIKKRPYARNLPGGQAVRVRRAADDHSETARTSEVANDADI